uniref:Geraniol 8-hydroxylase-like n=1 Tax=Nicotiana sylvestris TaxID=4096 RepID=A0A1U7Y5B4_NICSY|nr:PREDICTED: geraniol 8-hydroxylase-like [Nicotiana sylvestris]
MLQDLFGGGGGGGGGTETTTSTLGWAMPEIIRQPEIMKKTQTELAEVIGKGKIVEEACRCRATQIDLVDLGCIPREILAFVGTSVGIILGKASTDLEGSDWLEIPGLQVTLRSILSRRNRRPRFHRTQADVSQLPYLKCIIKETLRMHPPAPFLILRKVEQDVELCDYIILKGSQVLVKVWAIGRDSTSWEDPLVFKPERFWSSDVDMRGKDFELIPFGAG